MMAEDTRVVARLMEHAWAVNDLLRAQPHDEQEALRDMFLGVLDNDPVDRPFVADYPSRWQRLVDDLRRHGLAFP